MVRYYFTKATYNWDVDDIVRQAMCSALGGWSSGCFQATVLPRLTQMAVGSFLSAD